MRRKCGGFVSMSVTLAFFALFACTWTASSVLGRLSNQAGAISIVSSQFSDR